jgi:hypothetical protein
MRARRLSALGVFLGVCAAISVATPVQAQLGGLMRKAKEAAKEKTAEKDPRTPEAASSTSNPFADPAIVFITQDQLGRFEKGLQHEVAQRNALRKQLASLPTREQHQACSQSVATSPEAMKLIQDFADSSASLPVDQMMKRQQQMYADMAAMVEKKCGQDPQKLEGAHLERLRQIEAEASDIAMPPGYKAPPQAGLERETIDWAAMWNNAPAPTPVVMKVRDRRAPYFGEVPAAARAQAANARPFARGYAMLKERVPVFCQALSEKAPLTPTTITVGNQKMTVVKIRSKGSLEYVFRQDEAEALTNGCASVMALINTIFDDAQK